MGFFFNKTDYRDDLIARQTAEITELRETIERLEQRLQAAVENKDRPFGEIMEENMPKIEVIEDDEFTRIISKEENKFVLTHRQFDKSKTNRGWVDEGMPMVLIEIEGAQYVPFTKRLVKAPCSGFYEADSNKQIRYDEEICRIRRCTPEYKDSAFEELERAEIKENVYKKERKKMIERETLDELIAEGKVFNVFVKRDGNRCTIPMDIASAVWNRDGGRCCLCGSNEELEFDHIIPLSKGGATTFRNLQLLCRTCNRRKSDEI